MRRRVLELIAAFAAGAAVLALVALVAEWWEATSARVILNTERVERAIETSIFARRHLTAMISCPVNILQKSGVMFDCEATVRGQQFPVVVTETGGNGSRRVRRDVGAPGPCKTCRQTRAAALDSHSAR